MFWMNRGSGFIDQTTRENLVQPIGSKRQRLSRETGWLAARLWWIPSRRHKIGGRAPAREDSASRDLATSRATHLWPAAVSWLECRPAIG